MNLLNDFKNPELAKKLTASIAATIGDRPFSIMEVCGGQTHTIYKYKLREMLPPNLRLVSGPGCPKILSKMTDRGVSTDRSVYDDQLKTGPPDRGFWRDFRGRHRGGRNRRLVNPDQSAVGQGSLLKLAGPR